MSTESKNDYRTYTICMFSFHIDVCNCLFVVYILNNVNLLEKFDKMNCTINLKTLQVFKLLNNFRLTRLKCQKRMSTATKKETINEQEASTEETTHFGFQTVKESEKVQKVHKVFEDVAKSYDLMNDVMSIGIHRIWKDIFLERLGPCHGTRLLDMAGGTGDIAFRYIKYLANIPNPKNRQSHVTISDINQHMLDVGQERAKELKYIAQSLPQMSVEWKCEDAEKLTFPDDSFNAYTIAFGIRNCTHIDRVLSEAYRVLQPGGRFMCLEFSHLTNDVLQWLYDQYSFQVIPPMGQILAGQWDPYQYLVESIRKFPQQEEFKKMISAVGFQMVQYENLSFGVTSIHSGFKL